HSSLWYRSHATTCISPPHRPLKLTLTSDFIQNHRIAITSKQKQGDFIMAELIISAVVGDMVGRVISLLAGQFKGQGCTDAKLRRICHMLVKVHSAVEEAKGRHITNCGTLEWLSELNDGVYQGRYLLDTVRCREQELEDDHADKVGTQPFSLSLFNPAKRVRVAACAVKSLLSRNDVGGPEEIDRVVEILETISGDLKEFMMLLQNCQPIHRPLATNIFIEGQMFGRHVEKQRIINFLLHDGGPSTGGKLGVLPIVGGMGVGKTTLAQHVCDDERVRNHFPIILYSNFSYTRAMARGEAVFVLGSKNAVRDAKKFIKILHVLKEKYLSKRFLMVFEDVDMGKKQMLEELLPFFRHGKRGSRIMITTNNRGVASLGTVQPINLKVMPHQEYWFFFKAHAFAGRDVEEDPRMLAAGNAIARKLNGSFFGAKIVGRVLKAHPNLRFWCKVLGSNIGGLSLLGDGIGYIADLAENLLPNYANICEVTISKTPYPSQTELASVVAPRGDIGFAKVLLCRSVLPLQSLYYTAHCSLRGPDYSPEFTKLEGSRFAHLTPLKKIFPKISNICV
uniref:NB-ARC domain-containing protein n=1 Tax=Aegilops tauschii subsp. strangulata TaxID=200361 RepID=A0A453QP70_AEGTS